jgi:hypothetical protein
MSDWLVGRFRPTDPMASDPETQRAREAEISTLLREHGVDPADVMQAMAVTATDDGRHQLHVSRFLRNANGRMYLDVARDQVVSEPVVIDVEQGTWPAWLTGLNVPALLP